MATETPNHKLIKPEMTDKADISMINPNWDTLDTALKAVEDRVESNSTSINDIPKPASFGITMEPGYTFEVGATIEKFINIAFINLSINGTFTGGGAVKVGKLSASMRPQYTVRTPITWVPLAAENAGRVYIDNYGQVWVHLANGSATQASFSITYKTVT